MLKITYYHTLYKRDVTDIVVGNIEFKDDSVIYASAGHRRRVELEYVKSISPLEDD